MPYIIEIEGTDGSGKETQANLLKDRLSAIGYHCNVISFPYYSSDSSSLVKSMLSGAFGTSINKYASALSFSLDRYFSYITEWKQIIDTSSIVIFDRYTGSNYIYQTIDLPYNETINMISDINRLENKMELISPDITIFLNMPIDVSDNLIKDRKNKITNEDEKDIYEQDKIFRTKVYDNSLRIQQLMNWNKVDCVDANNNLKSIEDINTEIMDIIYLETGCTRLSSINIPV